MYRTLILSALLLFANQASYASALEEAPVVQGIPVAEAVLPEAEAIDPDQPGAAAIPAAPAAPKVERLLKIVESYINGKKVLPSEVTERNVFKLSRAESIIIHFEGTSNLRDIVPVLQKLPMVHLHLEFVSIPGIKDAELKCLNVLRNIVSLAIANCQFTDEQLKSLRFCTSIISLLLNDNPGITTKGMNSIIRLNKLRILGIKNNPKITAGFLAKLPSFPKLKTFSIDGSGIKIEDFAQINRGIVS